MRRITGCLLLLTVVVSASSTPAAASPANAWTMSGPSTAFIAAIAGSPSSAGHIYAGDQTGKLWRTRDDGSTWAEVSPTDPATASSSIQGVAVSPWDSNIVIATRGCRLYASADGGDSWQPPSGIATPASCDNVFPVAFPVAFDSNGTAWAYVASGLYSSSDDGLTWTLAGTPPNTPGAASLAIAPGNPQVIWVASTTGTISTSSDGGATWQDRSQGLPEQGSIQELVVDPAQPTTAYALVDWNVYRTTGGTWGGVFGNVGGSANGIFSMTVSPGSPETIVAGTDTGLHHSTDCGLTWSSSSGGPTAEYSATEAMAVDPASSSDVWAGGAGLFHSTDTGSSFTFLPDAIGRGEIPGLVSDPNDAQHLYASTDSNGVLRSDDGGATWHETGDQLIGQARGVAVDPYTPGTVLAAAGNYVYRSTDSGDTWTALTADVPGVNNAIAAAPDTPGVFYANGTAGIYRSTDHGASWTACGATSSDTAQPLNGLAVDPSNDSIVYAVGYAGIWRTTDDCAHWTTLPGRYAYQVSVGPDGTAYVATDVGAIAFAPGSNAAVAASTSTGYDMPMATYAIAADPAKADVAYAGTADGTYQTVDGGHRWTKLTTNGLDSAWSLSILVSGSTVSTGTTRGIATIHLNGPDATTNDPQTSGTTLTFNGTANPNGQSAQAFFEYGATSAYGQTTPRTDIGSGSADVPASAQITSTRNTSYHYRLVVVSGDGIATGADLTATIPPLPPVDSLSSATDIGLHGATLHGSVDPSSAATTYHFEWGTTTDYGSASAETQLAASAPTTVVSASPIDLTPDTTYHYRLVATNSGGSTATSDASLLTPAHLVPNVSLEDASDISINSATINASVDPQDTDTTYHIEWGPTPSSGSSTTLGHLAAGTGATPISASLQDLLPATVYHYHVVATNSGGTTVSDDATFHTADRPPHLLAFPGAELIAGRLQQSRVPLHLTWSAQAGDASICGYDLKRVAPAPTASLASPANPAANDLERPGVVLGYAVRADACDGLKSAWLNSPAQQLTLLQESASALHYRGSWETATVSSASGGHVRRTTSAGSRLTFTYTGRDVSLVAPTCATCTAVLVSIDGARPKRINLHSTTAVAQTVHVLARLAQRGTHTVTITAASLHGHTRVDLDAIARLT